MFVKSVKLGMNQYVFDLSKPSNSRRHFVLFSWAFATFLSINLISTVSTQLQSALGLIDVFSGNEHAEIFACILL